MGETFSLLSKRDHWCVHVCPFIPIMNYWNTLLLELRLEWGRCWLLSNQPMSASGWLRWEVIVEQARAARGPVLPFHCGSTSANHHKVKQSEAGFQQKEGTVRSGWNSRCRRSKRIWNVLRKMLRVSRHVSVSRTNREAGAWRCESGCVSMPVSLFCKHHHIRYCTNGVWETFSSEWCKELVMEKSYASSLLN